MTLQPPENVLLPSSSSSPITLNEMPVSYDARWYPVVVKEGRIIRRLDDLAKEPSTQLPETLIHSGEDVSYGNPFGRGEHRQQIGRRALAHIESGDYEKVLSILNPVMTPPLRRAIASGNPNSIEGHIARATDYKPL